MFCVFLSMSFICLCWTPILDHERLKGSNYLCIGFGFYSMMCLMALTAPTLWKTLSSLPHTWMLDDRVTQYSSINAAHGDNEAVLHLAGVVLG